MKENNFKNLNELIEFDKKNRILSSAEFKLNKYSTLVLSGFIPFSIYSLANKPDFISFILNSAFLVSNAYSLYSLKKLSLDYEKYRSNIPTYIELKNTYDKLLEDLLNEIELSSIDNDPLSIALLTSQYLIPNGLLSITKYFHIITSNEVYKIEYDYLADCDIQLLGTYVTNGYGCCRHINSFISDLLSKKGIKCDKVPCIFESLDNYDNIENGNYASNHLITGFIHNDYYYLVDPFNSRYNLIKNKNYFSSDSSNFYILNFTNVAYQKNLNWKHNLEYKNFSNSEVNEKFEKIKYAINKGEALRFTNFYIKHIKEIEKIHKLSLIEIERTYETECQKTKKYGK